MAAFPTKEHSSKMQRLHFITEAQMTKLTEQI